MRKIFAYLTMAGLLTACQNTSSPSAAAQKELPPDTTAKTATKPEKTTAVSGPVLGIDVSHFQGAIDWQKVKEAQLAFAYDKVSQGLQYKDPDYVQNREGAQAAELRHGGYHFYVAGDDPEKQAANFLSAVNYKAGDMPPVLDLEQGGMQKNMAVDTYQAHVRQWLEAVENKLKVQPIIYTNHPFGNEYLDHPDFAKYDLWIAEYGVDTPKIPNAWKEKGWLIWQRSERGKIEGAVGNVDHDIYNPKASVGFTKIDGE